MTMKNNIMKTLPSMLLIAVIFTLSTAASLAMGIPVSRIMGSFNYSVLIILIVMELFTGIVVETGIMQYLATKLAVVSKGDKRLCMCLFGILMFIISAFLNNITAVLMILPVIFVMLRAIDADRKYVTVFFAALLAICNLGGCASAVGDFPAIVIMTSGITTFMGYTLKAFPLCLLTTLILLVFWNLFIKEKTTCRQTNLLAVDLLNSRYRNIRVRKELLVPLGVIMGCMFLAWSLVPQQLVPPEVIAILGYGAAIVAASLAGVEIKQSMDMKSVLTIAAFLFLATVVSASGILEMFAQYLQANIPQPKVLLLVIMFITSIVAGVFSAGPAAAAMMPVIVNLCSTTLAAQSQWVAIAYAASICAGSSLFMWSATAGFILSGKINSAGLEEKGSQILWGIKEYAGYGIVNYLIQMSVAVLWMMAVI